MCIRDRCVCVCVCVCVFFPINGDRQCLKSRRDVYFALPRRFRRLNFPTHRLQLQFVFFAHPNQPESRRRGALCSCSSIAAGKPSSTCGASRSTRTYVHARCSNSLWRQVLRFTFHGIYKKKAKNSMSEIYLQSRHASQPSAFVDASSRLRH